MIAGSDWTHEDWQDFFLKQEAKRVDGKKCNCEDTFFRNVKPENRINKLFNWECIKCQKQFKGI